MGGKEPEDETRTTERSIDVVRTNERLHTSGSSSSQAGETEVARSILRLLCVSFVVAASEREGEILWDTSGWLGANGKGHFGWEYLSGNGTLGNWDNSTAHTTHTHTANGVIGMWEFCQLGSVWFVSLSSGARVCLARPSFAAFLDFCSGLLGWSACCLHGGRCSGWVGVVIAQERVTTTAWLPLFLSLLLSSSDLCKEIYWRKQA